MMRLACTIALAAVVAALNSCFQDVRTLPSHEPVTRPATPEVILISVDGYRADYFDRGDSSVLHRLAAEGVRARWLIPSFPTVTEPNHYTFLTGLYPDDHGIVDNDILDPQIQPQPFRMTREATLTNPKWWSEAIPLWLSVQRAGMRAGEVSWPSGWVRLDGFRPDFRFSGGESEQPDQATAEVLRWLELPHGERPRFIMLHYSPVDGVGHRYGPGSPEEDAALRHVDKAIGHLVDGLKQDDQYADTDLVIVSDHGMAAVPPGHEIYLDNIIHRKAVDLVTLGAEAGVDPYHGLAGRQAAEALLVPHRDMQCWRKQDLPAHLHYGHNPRVPTIVCIAQPGWEITTHWTMEHREYLLRGIHGYDNLAPSMRAIFVAEGPSFRHAIVVPPFPNVDVYPLLAHILRVTPERNDGDFARVAPLLKPIAR
jgi:predicted AlkP superfamily pyrophosphatase or phosphodiesterase